MRFRLLEKSKKAANKQAITIADRVATGRILR